MSTPDDTSRQLFDRARGVLVGGVNSPVRAFKGVAVGGTHTPRFIERAAGAHLFDADGNKLIDYISSWGAAIAGHAHPKVVEAIGHAAREGTSFGACSRREVELGELVLERVYKRRAGAHRVRFTNSGTEAVMTALRLARGATGRDLILKFEGCYHGHTDQLLIKAGSGVATLGMPDSAGVPADVAKHTLSARYNDLESVRSAFDGFGERIAGVIVEPIAGNMGVVRAQDGFLEALRKITRAHGTVLIFDEVMTGFRVAPGGATELLGVEPDLITLGKVVGGGMPVGAVAGTDALMNLLAPEGPVYQAGTLSGNPLAMACGKATLELLDDGAYQQLDASGARLERGLSEALRGRASVQRVGSMLTVFFGVDGVNDFHDAGAADHRAFARFFAHMLGSGVHPPPSGYEAWFLGLAHENRLIDQTIDAAEQANPGQSL